MSNSNTRYLLYCTAALSFGAAAIHAVVTPEHFEEWWGYGGFFLVATLAQVIFGILMLVQTRRYAKMADGERTGANGSTRFLCIAGILGNAVIIAMWLVTRTVGIPFFGPHAGEVEEIAGLDVASKVIETMLVMCLIVLARRIHIMAITASGANAQSPKTH